MPKNKPTTNLSKQPTKTKKQNQRLNPLSEKTPNFEKLDPEIYAKLQSTIHEVIEKTLPEYKEWLNSAFGEKIVGNDCTNGSLQNFDKMVVLAVNKAVENSNSSSFEAI